MTRRALFISIFIGAPAFASAAAPEFAQYPGETLYAGAAVQLDLKDPKVRRFRTVLRDSAREGPNFNGHYKVAKWGCGASCLRWAVINLPPGTVWLAQDPVTSCWGAEPVSASEAPDWFEIHSERPALRAYVCAPHPGR